jgi:putative phosphoesterase
MRVAALYDIHGNLPALEAVVNDVHRSGADAIVIGGDVVPGPLPRETMAYLRALDLPLRFVRGNGDREVLARMRGIDTGTVPPAFRDVIDWVADELGTNDERDFASWPPAVRLAIDGIGEVLFCHATPRNDTDIFTRDTPAERLAPIFADTSASLVVCGHTHMQFDRKIGQMRVVNAGSVGMPFGPPGAYWLLLGPGVALRHTPYDVDAAASRIAASRYPQAARFAEHNVQHPPAEADMLALYGRLPPFGSPESARHS